MFPLPSYFKRVAWILLIIWSIAAFVIALTYGLQFDIEYTQRDNPNNANYEIYQSEPCWQSSMALNIENVLSSEYFDEENLKRKLENTDNWGAGESSSWLLSIFVSLLTSLILWQPLTVYMLTWLKIWMFTWHLKMKIGPGNIILLCKKCCGYDVGDAGQSQPNILTHNDRNKPTHRSSKEITEVVANKNRPVDVISFLGNAVWIIDDTGDINVNNAAASETNHTNALLSSEDKDNNEDEFSVELSVSKTTSWNEPEIEMQERDNNEKDTKIKIQNVDDKIKLNIMESVKSLSPMSDTNLNNAHHILRDSMEYETPVSLQDIGTFNDIMFDDGDNGNDDPQDGMLR